MVHLRFVYVASLASLLSACALFQPVREKTAIDFAEDCIAHEAPIAAAAPTYLEAAASVVIRHCSPEIRNAEAALLALTRNDGRPAGAKLSELRAAQHALAKDMIALTRAK
jgi:hypothetical protein